MNIDFKSVKNLTVDSKTAVKAELDGKVVWRKKYSVTLDPQGGTLVTNVTSYAYGIKKLLPTDTTRENYQFLGWYSAPTDGTKYDSISQTATGNKKFYAHWQEII